MALILDEEQQLLKDSAKAFFESKLPRQRIAGNARRWRRSHARSLVTDERYGLARHGRSPTLTQDSNSANVGQVLS